MGGRKIDAVVVAHRYVRERIVGILHIDKWKCPLVASIALAHADQSGFVRRYDVAMSGSPLGVVTRPQQASLSPAAVFYPRLCFTASDALLIF